MPNGLEELNHQLDKMTTKEIIKQLYIKVYGIPGNPVENGMAGDVKETKDTVVVIADKVTTNTTWRKAHTWAIGGLFLTLAGIITLVCTTGV